MFGWLLLLLIVVPLADFALLLRVGRALTFVPTVGLVILTGIIGASLAKRQGLTTWAKINAELAAGRMPTGQLGEGLLILLAAAVLVTPGFITDALGLMLLVPFVRRRFLVIVTRYFKSRIEIQSMHMPPGTGGRDHAGDDDDDECVANRPRPMKHVENEALSNRSPPGRG